jgi:asparagine synthase (glutamine-hydrolysing)
LALAADEFRLRYGMRWQRKLLRWSAATLRRLGAPLPPYGLWDEYVAWPGARRLFRGMGFDPQAKERLCTSEFRQAVQDAGWRYLEDAWRAADNGDLATTLFAASFKTRLPSDYLVKVDRTAMMSALEVRCPFLDRELVEFAARVPASLKLKGGTQKYLLRALATRHLDSGAMQRPKAGFTIPLAEWLRSDLRRLVQDAVLGSGLRRRGIVDGHAAEALVEQHLGGRADHAHGIWALVCLELWFRRFVDTRRPSLINAS